MQAFLHWLFSGDRQIPVPTATASFAFTHTVHAARARPVATVTVNVNCKPMAGVYPQGPLSLGWVALLAVHVPAFRHSSFFRSRRTAPSSIPVIVPMTVTGSPSWTLLNRGYLSSSTSTWITAPALLSP